MPSIGSVIQQQLDCGCTKLGSIIFSLSPKSAYIHRAWTTCSLLRFPTGISDFFGYNALNHTESSCLPSLLPSFCLSIFCQPSADVSSLLSLFQAGLLEGLYCSFAWGPFPVCLPLHRGILPVPLSWSNFPRRHTQKWQECLLPVSKGHSHRMGLFFSSLDFFKRMHTNDTELVLLCPRTKSYCLFEIPKVCSTAL